MSEPAELSPRDRVTQVFRYLEELNRIRNPVIRDLRTAKTWFRWLDALPAHPFVEFHPPNHRADTVEDVGVGKPLLRVERVMSTPPPEPPKDIASALSGDWKDPAAELTELPEDDAEPAAAGPREEAHRRSRQVAFKRWKAQWDAWAAAERLARDARELFESLYSLHGDMERESGRYELLIGDGHLLWEHEIGEIRHPLLLQRVELRFEPSIPAFTVAELDVPPELYSTLLTNLAEVDGSRLKELTEELQSTDIHPFGGSATDAFLRRLALVLGPNGQLREERLDAPLSEEPVLARRPVFFRRKKSQGMAAALGHILDDIKGAKEISPALMRIVGAPEEGRGSEISASERETACGAELLDVLLAKPANPEQIQIAERLERHGSVLVQGPPGTGKTHTIGNLIGHLLSQGKSVLVTSQGTKALRVLREQIPKPLQPLCVSVLDDAEGQRQLEDSITLIAERLATADASSLEREAAQLDKRRRHEVQQLKDLQRRLLEATTDEYRDLVFGGEGMLPADAAREVAVGVGRNDWIPAPVELGAAIPLTTAEVHRLYALNGTLSVAEERELQESLPDPAALPAPSEFTRLLEQERSLAEKAGGDSQSFWAHEPDHTELSSLEASVKDLQRALEELPAWKAEAIAAGEVGGTRLEPWAALLDLIERVAAAADAAAVLLFEHAPQPRHEQAESSASAAVIAELRAHLETGGRLSTWTLLTKRSWRRLLDEWTLATGEVTDLNQVLAIQARIELTLLRRQLVGRWNRQLVPMGLPPAEQMGNAPERRAQQYAVEFRRFLDLHPSAILPFEFLAESTGLRWEAILEAHPPVLEEFGQLHRLRRVLREELPGIIECRRAKLQLGEVQSRLTELIRALESFGGETSRSVVVRALFSATLERDGRLYAKAHGQLVALRSRNDDLLERQSLLKRLEEVAPGWAQTVRERVGRHAERVPPGDCVEAWRWRQLNDELERRGSVRLEDLQREMERVSADLRRTTTALIDCKAWAAQVRRSTSKQRQTLMGWLHTVKRIGKGTGKRVPRLRAEASRAIAQCRDAVPVWVMSLDQVAHNFPASSRFDVVIIDEASQSDVMALAAVYLAKQVVVVGDHEQVSPSAVGENVARVERLIDQHLKSIPNASLYTGQMSVYDLAQQSFEGLICLREHFRSVPDIIRFSSELSYEGRIEPLRDASSSTLRPAVTAYRVRGGSAEDKVNEREAEAVTALIVAASRNPAYQGKSFGVISLVGDEQALRIEQKLRDALSPSEYDRRRLLCGNAAQFQGDERDVMFLSMVDSPKDGPLALRATDNKTFKQRFNVAASRARDQLWVVHSLNVGTDLKPGDLRRRLIEHCADPRALEHRFARDLGKTESPFEKEVFKRLTRAGYHVIPQWPVGSYRIDLVVEGANGKAAVECDGDRYHSQEKIGDDMARQAVLERLGWRFVRIRGSAFFRDPERAMAPVFKRLEELGVEPGWRPSNSAPAEQSEELQSVIRDAEKLVRVWGGQTDSDDHTPVEAVEKVQNAPTQAADPTARAALTSLLGGGADSESTMLVEPRELEAAMAMAASRPRRQPRAPDPVRMWPNGEVVEVEVLAPASDQGALKVVGDRAAKSTTASEEELPAPPDIALVPAPSMDPVMDALTQALSPEHQRCPKCDQPRELLIGRYGPFMKCDDRSCAATESVQRDVLSQALASLGVKCTCGASFKVAKGRSVFVGCSGFPACRERFSWKDFRALLAESSGS